jgi:hypothetical protein
VTGSGMAFVARGAASGCSGPAAMKLSGAAGRVQYGYPPEPPRARVTDL